MTDPGELLVGGALMLVITLPVWLPVSVILGYAGFLYVKSRALAAFSASGILFFLLWLLLVSPLTLDSLRLGIVFMPPVALMAWLGAFAADRGSGPTREIRREQRPGDEKAKR